MTARLVSWFAPLTAGALLMGCSASSPTDSNSQGVIGAPMAGASNGVNGGGAGGAGTAGMNAGGNGGYTGVVPGGPAGGSAGTGMGGAPLSEGGAGTGGAGGTAGASMGGNGMGGGSAVGNGPSGPSTGCGTDHFDEQPGAYTTHEINITGLTEDQITQRERPPEDGQDKRVYFTKLPENYDPARAYPIVFYGPGCGASMQEPTPMDGAVGEDGLIVFLLQKQDCFYTSDRADNRSAELNYFEQVLAEVQNNYCTDKGKVFLSGYSSGAWFSNLIGCYHGDKIRAIGTAAGGFRPPESDEVPRPPCVGNISGIFHGGRADDANPISRMDDNGVEYGSIAGRNRLIEANGCDAAAAEPWPTFPDECTLYQEGCPTNPVVWCEDDQGHTNGGKFSQTGFWDFWMSLPPK